MRVFHPGEYQEQASRVYEEARSALAAALPVARIEHIGSSAIPGAHSKGDVDLCVCVTREDFDAALSAIERLGYVVKQDTLRDEQLCMLELPGAGWPVAVQLIEQGSKYETCFFGFRDALAANAELLAEYNRIKRESAALGEVGYRSAKARFIERVLASHVEAARGSDQALP